MTRLLQRGGAGGSSEIHLLGSPCSEMAWRRFHSHPGEDDGGRCKGYDLPPPQRIRGDKGDGTLHVGAAPPPISTSISLPGRPPLFSTPSPHSSRSPGRRRDTERTPLHRATLRTVELERLHPENCARTSSQVISRGTRYDLDPKPHGSGSCPPLACPGFKRLPNIHRVIPFYVLP